MADIKSEWNMADLTFKRFHELFIQADFLGIQSRNFNVGVLMGLYSVLKQLWINLFVFVDVPMKRDEIDMKFDYCNQIITQLYKIKNSGVNNTVKIEKIKELREKLEELHREIIFHAAQKGLLVPFFKELSQSERIKKAIKGEFIE